MESFSSFHPAVLTHKPHAGFTLIELLVVVAIIGVVSTTVLASQSNFNQTLVLSNTAYDVALTLRSAQSYGLGSRIIGGVSNAGYGLNFTRAVPGTFTFFADTYPGPSVSSECHPTTDASAPDAQPGNCVYDSAQGEKVTDYTFGNGVTISDFCAYALGSWSCAYAQGGTLSSLAIIFARPNSDPYMSVNGTFSAAYPITSACLALTSPQGGAEYVSVSAAGQINANATSCP